MHRPQEFMDVTPVDLPVLQNISQIRKMLIIIMSAQAQQMESPEVWLALFPMRPIFFILMQQRLHIPPEIAEQPED